MADLNIATVFVIFILCELHVNTVEFEQKSISQQSETQDSSQKVRRNTPCRNDLTSIFHTSGICKPRKFRKKDQKLIQNPRKTPEDDNLNVMNKLDKSEEGAQAIDHGSVKLENEPKLNISADNTEDADAKNNIDDQTFNIGDNTPTVKVPDVIDHKAIPESELDFPAEGDNIIPPKVTDESTTVGEVDIPPKGTDKSTTVGEVDMQLPEKIEKPILTEDNEDENKGEDITLVQSEDIPSFDEWKIKMLNEQAQQGKIKGQDVIQTSNGDSKKHNQKKVNYASGSCGAKLAASNPEAQNPTAILSENKDKYMIQPCKAKKWFVVELCEPVKVEQLQFGNQELFSSLPESFVVSVSDRFPAKEWKTLGTFKARDERKVQNFYIGDDMYAKFLKVEMLSHFGKEHYCPLTVLRVYGQDLHEDDGEEAAHESVIDDLDDLVPMDEDKKDEEPTNLFDSAKDTVISLVKSVMNGNEKPDDSQKESEKTETVTVGDKSVNDTTEQAGSSDGTVLEPCLPKPTTGVKDTDTKQGMEKPDNPHTPEVEISPDTQIEKPLVVLIEEPEKPAAPFVVLVCPYCSNYTANDTCIIHSVCQYYKLMNTKQSLTTCALCKPSKLTDIILGDDRVKKTVDEMEKRSKELGNVADKSTDKIISIEDKVEGNGILDKSGQILEANKVNDIDIQPSISAIPKGQSSGVHNANTESIHIPAATQTITSTVKETPAVTETTQLPSKGTSVKRIDPTPVRDNTIGQTAKTPKHGPDPIQVVQPNDKAVSNNGSNEMNNTVKSKQAHKDSKLKETKPRDDNGHSKTLDVKVVNKSKEESKKVKAALDNKLSGENGNKKPKSAEETGGSESAQSTGKSDKIIYANEQLGDNIINDEIIDGSETTENEGDNTEQQYHRFRSLQKETTYMKLKNKIRELEINLTLSSRYLEELSKKYKQRMEDMYVSLNRTIQKLTNTSKAAEIRDLRQQERISLLENKMENFTRLTEQLNDSLGRVHYEVIERHLYIMLLEVTVFLIFMGWCLHKQKYHYKEKVRTVSNSYFNMAVKNISPSPSGKGHRRGTSVDLTKNSQQEKETPSKRQVVEDVSIITPLKKSGSVNDVTIVEPDSSFFVCKSLVKSEYHKKKKKKKSLNFNSAQKPTESSPPMPRRLSHGKTEPSPPIPRRLPHGKSLHSGLSSYCGLNRSNKGSHSVINNTAGIIFGQNNRKHSS